MKSKLTKRYSLWFLLPGVLIYFIFFIIPSIQSLFYSFTYWDIFTVRFAGLSNYIDILTDKNLSITIWNTLIFTTVTTTFKVGLGMALAIFLNQKLRTEKFLRTVYFSPCILNNIAVGIMFTALLHPTTGLVNEILRALNLDFLVQSWLTDKNLAIFSVSGIEVWKWTGFTMVILLAGLQMIPTELYEVASVDGASKFQQFKKITIPLMMPAITNAVIVNLMGGLKVFDIIYSTTKGGPGNATEVINSFVFKSFGQGRYGEACAGSVLLSIMVGIIVMSSYKILTRKEVEL